MSEPKIFRIKLRSFEIDVVAVDIKDAMSTWRREVANNDAINYDEGDEPDSLACVGQWVAISDKASRAYKADIKERSK